MGRLRSCLKFLTCGSRSSVDDDDDKKKRCRGKFEKIFHRLRERKIVTVAENLLSGDEAITDESESAEQKMETLPRSSMEKHVDGKELTQRKKRVSYFGIDGKCEISYPGRKKEMSNPIVTFLQSNFTSFLTRRLLVEAHTNMMYTAKASRDVLLLAHQPHISTEEKKVFPRRRELTVSISQTSGDTADVDESRWAKGKLEIILSPLRNEDVYGEHPTRRKKRVRFFGIDGKDEISYPGRKMEMSDSNATLIKFHLRRFLMRRLVVEAQANRMHAAKPSRHVLLTAHQPYVSTEEKTRFLRHREAIVSANSSSRHEIDVMESGPVEEQIETLPRPCLKKHVVDGKNSIRKKKKVSFYGINGKDVNYPGRKEKMSNSIVTFIQSHMRRFLKHRLLHEAQANKMRAAKASRHRARQSPVSMEKEKSRKEGWGWKFGKVFLRPRKATISANSIFGDEAGIDGAEQVEEKIEVLPPPCIKKEVGSKYPNRAKKRVTYILHQVTN